MGFNYTKLINFYWCLLVCLLITNSGFGQTRVFANGIISQSNTDDSANAIDSDLSTKANIRAKDFPGSYSGYLELEFPSLIPAETTAYVKIDADEPILEPLLAGGLGDFLGAVLVSKQEFTVQVKNVNTIVLQGDSNDAGEFGTSRMRLVMNEAGEYFIVITPDQAFNRIRIVNRIDQGITSIGTKRLGVYGAFYNTSEVIGDCGVPSFTSYDGSNISSGLLGIGGVGVNDPENAIDNDDNSFSELNLGLIGVGSSIEQILYFEELSHSNDVFNLNLKLNSGLLALGVLDNIEILGYNGADLVASESLTDLLNLDLLGLFQNDQNAEVPFAPGAPIDRIVIRFSSLITLTLPQKLEIHEVKKVPGPPTFDASSQDVDICKGESASLIAVADPNDLELRWYDSAVDGTLLGTVASGTPFVTSAILADTTFYVAAAEVGCPEESERTPVEVTVVPSPEATDITVTGNESTICSTNTVTLVPDSALSGSFSWYLDANKSNQITDGMVDSGITYNIDSNDELTITGLSGLNSPYTYYVSITDSSTGCENMDGELKSVLVTIQDNTLAPTITLDPNITADDIVNSDEAIGLVNITGVVGGDAQVNDVVTLTINNVSYQGNVAADFSFSIPVNGSDLIADADTTIDASVETTNGICTNTGMDTESYTVDTTAPNPPTVNTLLTNDTTPTITGTADSADMLTVTLDGTTYTEGDGNLTDNGDGTWTLTVPAGNELAEGTYNVAATATDLAGNTADDITVDELTIDLTDPTPPTVNTLLTNDTTPTITGTADSADILTVTLDGTTYTEGDGNLTDNGDGTWTLTVPAGNELAEGTYDVAATTTDLAGNTANDLTTDEISIEAIQPPTTNSAIQEFCAIDLPRLNDIQINESNILWYDNNIGGNLLDHSTLLEHQKTYYASLLLGDLESTARLGITINLIQPPSATSESLTQVFSTADNPTLGDIQVNESNIIWYDAPVLGNILDFDTTLVDGTNYYAALIDSNCESLNRLAIRVQVDGISDLIISKEASSQNPMVGENVNFIITVTNDGDTNFTDLTINERIESGFAFMQYTATKGTYNPSNGVWSINNIGPREQVALNIVATVMATGSYFNSASISKSTPLDNNLNNNSAEIVLEPSCLKVFNEFTPNDDGDNDYFKIDCIEMYPESDFQVFNRYGALVYQKKGYQNDWRGLANVKGVVGKGEPLPTGTYFYKLKTDDLSESKTGWLFLRKD